MIRYTSLPIQILTLLVDDYDCKIKNLNILIHGVLHEIGSCLITILFSTFGDNHFDFFNIDHETRTRFDR